MAGASAQTYLPEWQEGYMDIHTIATGRGDATFIVMPDGTTLMIDAGDNGKLKDPQHPDTTKRAGEWQAIYMKKVTRRSPIGEWSGYRVFFVSQRRQPAPAAERLGAHTALIGRWEVGRSAPEPG